MGPLAPFSVDYNSGLPVWVQLRNRIAYLIASGAYKEGDRLPTVRALGTELDVSYNTVNRAYMDLEREGYIDTRRGRGTFVTGSNVGAVDGGRASIAAMADDLIQAARTFGMEDSDILVLMQEKLS